MSPTHLTHYFHETPFQTISDLPTDEMVTLLRSRNAQSPLPRRLLRPVYYQQRRRYERKMRQQFIAQGGQPRRSNPIYMVLGESEFWGKTHLNSIRIPLADIPADQISFTSIDSWYAYVDFDLNRRPIPAQPHYNTVYRVDHLDHLLAQLGWPRRRQSTEPEYIRDYYIEAQVWADEPLLPFLHNSIPA